MTPTCGHGSFLSAAMEAGNEWGSEVIEMSETAMTLIVP